MTVLEKAAAKMKKYRVPYRTECAFNELTTLGTGGKIYLTIVPENARQLVWAAKYLSRRQIPHCFVGYGSNILASDDFYEGVAVVTKGVKGCVFQDGTVTAQCGLSTSALCSKLVNAGLCGGEFFGCLPATVGGATVCNAGCFGQSVQDVVKSVTLLEKGKLRRIEAKDCLFSKRNSLFKQSGCLVLQTEMVFGRDNPQRIQSRLSAMRRHKALTQPLGCRSAGCVLFHPTISLSPLIERAGLKGFRIGGAEVSQKHAGFIVNVDKASSADVYLLIRHVKKALCEMGVNAMTEVCLINFPPKEQQCPFPVR